VGKAVLESVVVDTCKPAIDAATSFRTVSQWSVWLLQERY
jgi:hypothetical protein